MTPVPAPGESTFAARLNLLFEASAFEDPKCAGRYVEYTNQQVAETINRRHGDGTITAEYIRRLRKEGGPNPTAPYLSVLAQFFQVSLDVFDLTSTAENKTASGLVAELKQLLEERRQQGNEALTVLARSARRLSPQGQARLVQYVQKLEEVEQMENEVVSGDPKPPEHD